MSWKLTKYVLAKTSYENEAPTYGWRIPPGAVFSNVEDTPNPLMKKVTTPEGRVGYVPVSALIEI